MTNSQITNINTIADELNYEVVFYEDNVIGVVYKKPSNRSKLKINKKIYGYKYNSIERMYDDIERYLTETKRAIEIKAAMKEKDRKENRKKADEVQVGDIFISSWGWEQTNVDAYQVVNKKGITVELLPINLKSIEQVSWGADRVIPVKDSFIKDNDVIKKRLNGNAIRFSSFQHASVHKEGAIYYRSWYA